MSDSLKTLILISKVTGFLSMGGSSFIMYEILSDKRKLQKTYFRLMLGMSLIEFCDGLAYFLGSWCVPEGFLAAGNAASCTFQGFLLQASIGSTLYNAFLALYYLLSIKYNWSERLIAKKVEPWMHGISLSLAYSTAIAGAALGLYASYGDICYIAKTPFDCIETYRHGYTTCIQGDNSSLYLIFFFTIWEWSSIVFTALSMLLIWWHIRHTENRMTRYTFGENTPVRKNSKRFAKQGALYVLVFYFSHFFSTVLIYYLRSGRYNEIVVYVLRVLYGLTYPLEGFLNFLVYIRPRMIKKWKKRDGRTKSSALTTESGFSEAPRDTFIARIRAPETVRAFGKDPNIHGVGGTESNQKEADCNESSSKEEGSESESGGESSQGLNSQGLTSYGAKELGRIVEEVDESMLCEGEGDEINENTTSSANTAPSRQPPANSARSSSSSRSSRSPYSVRSVRSKTRSHRLADSSERHASRYSVLGSFRLTVEVSESEILEDETEHEELYQY